MNRFFNDIRFALSWGILSLVVVCLFVAIFLVSKTFVDNDAQNYPKTISVSGKGEVISIPDIASFNFSIIESSENVSSAQALATEKANKVLDFLKKSGVEEKDLKTTGYNIYPKYEWIQPQCFSEINCPRGENKLVGYEVNQTISVKVRDTEKAGELLSGIGNFNVSNVSGLNFQVDDEDAVIEQARVLAIEDAKDKAKKLTKSLGVKLGDVVGFNEDSGFYPQARFMEASFDEGLGGGISASPQIPTGENTIIRTVYIIYELD